MDVIKINSTTGRKLTINLDDISAVELRDRDLFIYTKGRSDPIVYTFFDDEVTALKAYETLLSIIPHTTISTINLQLPG